MEHSGVKWRVIYGVVYVVLCYREAVGVHALWLVLRV